MTSPVLPARKAVFLNAPEWTIDLTGDTGTAWFGRPYTGLAFVMNPFSHQGERCEKFRQDQSLSQLHMLRRQDKWALQATRVVSQVYES